MINLASKDARLHRWQRRKAAVTGLFVALLASVSLCAIPVLAQSQHAKEVGMKLKCLCKGCDMSAGGCAHPGGAFSGPCDTAQAELKEVDDLLNQGQTEQQVIESFVRKYGTIAYVEPPKHGFGLVAWAMPIFYIVVGLGVVVLVVRKWSQHKPAASAASAGANVSGEALERARARAARETED
jgi:Cytochrome C biogenesis protein